MKKFYLIICCLIVSLLSVGQTAGELSLRVTTSDAGGVFSPKNIVAVWIEDESGNFVKTVYAYNGTWVTHLNMWEAASTYNTVDAQTGATYQNHTTRNYTWNATNTSSEVVADGIYNLWIELTDKNATGNYASFSFTKGAGSQALTPANQASFSGIEITWTPASNRVKTSVSADQILISPNPSNGIINIQGENIRFVEVRNITGQLITKTTNQSINISNQPNGLYLVKVVTAKGTHTRKVIKQ